MLTCSVTISPSPFSDRPAGPGVVFPGAGDPWLRPRGLRVPAVSLAPAGCVQTGPGSISVRATSEPLLQRQAAVGLVPEAPAGRLH